MSGSFKIENCKTRFCTCTILLGLSKKGWDLPSCSFHTLILIFHTYETIQKNIYCHQLNDKITALKENQIYKHLKSNQAPMKSILKPNLICQPPFLVIPLLFDYVLPISMLQIGHLTSNRKKIKKIRNLK